MDPPRPLGLLETIAAPLTTLPCLAAVPAPHPGDRVTVELGAGAAERGSQVQGEMGLGA